MDFSERLGQMMHEVWGYDVVGDLGKDGYLEFFPTDMVSEPEVVRCKDGLFAYYRCDGALPCAEIWEPYSQKTRLFATVFVWLCVRKRRVDFS